MKLLVVIVAVVSICSCDCCSASYIVLKILKGQDSSVPYGVDKG